MYQAQLDVNTRPWHAIHHGEIFKVGEPWPETLDEPNCLLPGNLVSGAFVAGMKAFYSGGGGLGGRRHDPALRFP